jgi:molybdopterin/thiamine biosynthesis adenylyltransferase
MANEFRVCGVSKEEAQRYSRQILVSDVGVAGFRKISEVSILVVGAGGLGSPAALYLAGAGVKCLGIVDGDQVDITNLHRQTIHSEARVGMNKAASGALACRALNGSVSVCSHEEFLNERNALDIIAQYDVIVDATDNVVTRYLLNDACVLLRKPLVSGSALRMEGQLTVYSYCGGPCYRCIFPNPPPAHSVTNCSDGGVLGPVPGVIGTLQVIFVEFVCRDTDPTIGLTGDRGAQSRDGQGSRPSSCRAHAPLRRCNLPLQNGKIAGEELELRYLRRRSAADVAAAGGGRGARRVRGGRRAGPVPGIAAAAAGELHLVRRIQRCPAPPGAPSPLHERVSYAHVHPCPRTPPRMQPHAQARMHACVHSHKRI